MRSSISNIGYHLKHYDQVDRTAMGSRSAETTTFNYLGLSGEVLDEEVAGAVTRSYQYSPWGERLSQVTHNPDGSSEDGFYGYNPHTDVETVTDEAGNTEATYGYTAYGNNNTALFTGVDKPTAGDPTAEPYNVYRFNSKRWDQASSGYDMGFRNYNPGLNRFLTRDMYNGALADLNLGTSPYTANRYAFAAGNPISMVEQDGHEPRPWHDPNYTGDWKDAYVGSDGYGGEGDASANEPQPVIDIVSRSCVEYCGRYLAESVENRETCLQAHLIRDLFTNECDRWRQYDLLIEDEIDRHIESLGLDPREVADNPWDAVQMLEAGMNPYPTTATPSSRRLARNLEDAGFVRQAGEQAHHILAGRARGAANARAILFKFGIDINAAANGVFLEPSAHYTTFGNSYYAAVDELLGAATTKDEVVTALGTIRQGLLDGTFP